MSGKRAIFLIVATSLVLTGLNAPPAAAEVGGGEFKCSGEFQLWAGEGFTTCTGFATGVYREGPTVVVCNATCGYGMTMTYNTTCVAGEPVLVASYAGQIIVQHGDTFDTPYAGVSLGPDFVLTTSSPVGAGDALLALLPPIGTCGAPYPVRFEMAGTLIFD
jgi:hypothetical protein